jgi:hypothetical protein
MDIEERKSIEWCFKQFLKVIVVLVCLVVLFLLLFCGKN